MTARRKYNVITPEQLKDCLDRGMGVQGASLSLNVSKSNARAAAALFGWSPKHGNQHSYPKPHSANNPFGLGSADLTASSAPPGA